MFIYNFPHFFLLLFYSISIVLFLLALVFFSLLFHIDFKFFYYRFSDTPGRNEMMKNAEINFQEHAKRMTQAATVAAVGASQHNKALVQTLNNKILAVSILR